MQLNRKQSGIVYVALAILAAMLVCPPFVLAYRSGGCEVTFRFVGVEHHDWYGVFRVDVPRLSCMCLAVIVAAAGFLFALRNRT